METPSGETDDHRAAVRGCGNLSCAAAVESQNTGKPVRYGHGPRTPVPVVFCRPSLVADVISAFRGKVRADFGYQSPFRQSVEIVRLYRSRTWHSRRLPDSRPPCIRAGSIAARRPHYSCRRLFPLFDPLLDRQRAAGSHPAKWPHSRRRNYLATISFLRRVRDEPACSPDRSSQCRRIATRPMREILDH